MKDGGAAAFFLIWKRMFFVICGRGDGIPGHSLVTLISVLFSADKCS